MTDAFSLSEEQLAIQEMARGFTADAISPHAARWDEEHCFPREVMEAAGDPKLSRGFCSGGDINLLRHSSLSAGDADP